MVCSSDAEFNLFSITKRLIDGWELSGNDESLWITKGSNKVVFDIKIRTPKGAIYATYFKHDLGEEGEVAAVMTDKKCKVNAEAVHGLMGHMNNTDA